MSEPLRTEPVKASEIFVDKLGRPFKPSKSSEVMTSLGHQSDVYEFIKHSFGKEIEEVRPVIPGYERISSEHRRNMTETFTTKAVVWGGSLSGDIYGARTVKGTSMLVKYRGGGEGNIGIDDFELSRYGLRGFGLMDDSVSQRIIKASETMRQNGLPTERPRSIKELKEVWVRNKYRKWERKPVKVWEQERLDKIRVDINTAKERGGSTYIVKQYGERLKKVERYLRETKFIALERDVQVDKRIENVIEAANNKELREMIVPIFKWLNAATQTRNSGLVPNTPKPEPFSYTEGDLKRYFGDYLPSQMGIYLARFHKLGLFHKYLHPGNWSAVGTIYDLDSVGGKIMFSDDEKHTDKDLVGDVTETLSSLKDLAYSMKIESGYGGRFENQVTYTFLRNYLTEKYGPEVKEDQISKSERNVLHDDGIFFNSVMLSRFNSVMLSRFT